MALLKRAGTGLGDEIRSQNVRINSLARRTRFDGHVSCRVPRGFKEILRLAVRAGKRPQSDALGPGVGRGRQDAPGRARIWEGGIRAQGAAGLDTVGRIMSQPSVARRGDPVQSRPRQAAKRRATHWARGVEGTILRLQQPPERTNPQPKSVLRLPGPSVSTEARNAARTALSDPAPCAICRAASAVTMGAANEVPLT